GRGLRVRVFAEPIGNLSKVRMGQRLAMSDQSHVDRSPEYRLEHLELLECQLLFAVKPRSAERAPRVADIRDWERHVPGQAPESLPTVSPFPEIEDKVGEHAIVRKETYHLIESRGQEFTLDSPQLIRC